MTQQVYCSTTMSTAPEENEVVSALTGFSLDQILTTLSLPARSALSSQLGISGIPALKSSNILNENWDDDGAVGSGQGQDWEAEVDREMQEEGPDESIMKPEMHVREKKKRTRVVRRLVERPKSVYERFPAFERDKILDFSELFKGYTVRKSRLAKRPFHGTLCIFTFNEATLMSRKLRVCIQEKKKFKGGSWKLSWVILRGK